MESSPDVPNEPAEQGSLFHEVEVPSGITEPSLHRREVEFEPAPEGAYPEHEETDSYEEPTGSEIAASVHEAVARDRRSRAQRGKHSPLERDGHYNNIQLGDYLPGWGAVTKRNFSEAREYAKLLEQRRLQP